MPLLRLLPEEIRFSFMRFRRINYFISLCATMLSLLLFFTLGLNDGIDFKGGTLIEIQTKEGKADLARLRTTLSALNLGDIQLQHFGSEDTALIRIELQDEEEISSPPSPEISSSEVEVEEENMTLSPALRKVQNALGDGVVYRRVEVVGPRVSGELAWAGTLAVLSALAAILVYLWLRFEWHFAVGAVLTTVHDVILTVGLFAMLQLDFNLSSIAAILTIVGYSLNDTVVIYDRIRENLRRYKRKNLEELLDLSINQTLARTLMTSLTTLLALFSLYFLGGEVIRSFVFAMIWGIIVGTYSSIFVAAPLLISLGFRPDGASASSISSETAKGEEKTSSGTTPSQVS